MYSKSDVNGHDNLLIPVVIVIEFLWTLLGLLDKFLVQTVEEYFLLHK